MTPMKHGLPFALRLRAHSAGLEDLVERIAMGGRDGADLLAIAKGPLPLLAALAREGRSQQAAVVGILPVRLLPDVSETCEKALAHRAAAEAEVLDLQAPSSTSMGAIDQAAEVISRLRQALPGVGARMDWESLERLAKGAGLPVEGAAGRLAAAGLSEVRTFGEGPLEVGPLPVHLVIEAPEEIDEDFVSLLLEGPRRHLSLVAGKDTTGIQLLRAAALAGLSGHAPITVIGGDELKGADASLCFGADRIEAELDPAGSLGSRTRAYGEAAILGAQLGIMPPRRRAEEKGRVAHILDEEVDPALLPGGDTKALEVVS